MSEGTDGMVGVVEAPTLTDFLLARISEDEAAARGATPSPWRWEGDYPQGTCPHGTEWTDHGPDLMSPSMETLPNGMEIPRAVLRASGYDASSLDVTDADAAHIARHDPARVLAECEAKRRVVHTMQTAIDQAWQDGSMRLVVEHIANRALRALALPYADHPDYQPEWRH